MRRPLGNTVRITLKPERRLCLLCLEMAGKEVRLGTEDHGGKMCFALCDDCPWKLKTAIEESP